MSDSMPKKIIERPVDQAHDERPKANAARIARPMGQPCCTLRTAMSIADRVITPATDRS